MRKIALGLRVYFHTDKKRPNTIPVYACNLQSCFISSRYTQVRLKNARLMMRFQALKIIYLPKISDMFGPGSDMFFAFPGNFSALFWRLDIKIIDRHKLILRPLFYFFFRHFYRLHRSEQLFLAIRDHVILRDTNQHFSDISLQKCSKVCQSTHLSNPRQIGSSAILTKLRRGLPLSRPLLCVPEP